MDCKKHPSINKIREQFRLEQSNTEVLYTHIGAGDVIKKLIALILFYSRFIY
jgi:hypothetical protein